MGCYKYHKLRMQQTLVNYNKAGHVGKRGGEGEKRTRKGRVECYITHFFRFYLSGVHRL